MIWLEIVPFCVPGSKISRAGSQVGFAAAPLVGAREPDRLVERVRVHECLQRRVLVRRDEPVPHRVDQVAARVGAVGGERLLVVEVVAERQSAARGVDFSVNGSLQVAEPWGILAARTALRVSSVDRQADRPQVAVGRPRHPRSDERPKSPPLAAVPPAQLLKCGTE
jgi:hypothetical protein